MLRKLGRVQRPDLTSLLMYRRVSDGRVCVSECVRKKSTDGRSDKGIGELLPTGMCAKQREASWKNRELGGTHYK